MDTIIKTGGWLFPFIATFIVLCVVEAFLVSYVAKHKLDLADELEYTRYSREIMLKIVCGIVLMLVFLALFLVWLFYSVFK